MGLDKYIYIVLKFVQVYTTLCNNIYIGLSIAVFYILDNTTCLYDLEIVSICGSGIGNLIYKISKFT